MLPDEIAKLPLELEKLFYELQDRIMSDVVRRLKKTGEITSTADYQLNKYLILGGTTEQIESEIKRLTGMTDAEIWEAYDRVVEKDYTRFKSVYEQVNGEFLQYEDNPELQDWVTATVQQTQHEIKNITQSMGFTVDMGGGKKAFTPLSMYYQKYLDRACLDVVTGSFDYGSVLRRVTKEMAASGLQSIPYASGHVSSSIVAARRALLTGVNQLSAKINEKVGKELNAEYFEVTAHENARPSHAEWQGRVYTRRQLEEVCGLGSVTGLCGANCRHAYYAFIPGVSQRAYTDEYLEKLAEDEAKTRTWNGKEYNAYERTQKQRQYESDMRKQRAYIKALKAGGADPKDIQAAQARYTNTLHEYQAFSKKMGLKEQLERVYVDGLGRMTGGRVPGKVTLTDRKVVGNSFYAGGKASFENDAFLFTNTDEEVSGILAKLDIDDNPELKLFLRNNIKHMPLDDFDLLEKADIKIKKDIKNRIIGDPTKQKNGRKIYEIHINPDMGIPFAFAHEYAHFSQIENNLYRDPEFRPVLEHFVSTITGYGFSLIDNELYVIAKSDLLVDPYQGRTYVKETRTGFERNIEPDDYIEYISKGYETYIENPGLLEKKDIMLYNYLKKRGLR